MNDVVRNHEPSSIQIWTRYVLDRDIQQINDHLRTLYVHTDLYQADLILEKLDQTYSKPSIVDYFEAKSLDLVKRKIQETRQRLRSNGTGEILPLRSTAWVKNNHGTFTFNFTATGDSECQF